MERTPFFIIFVSLGGPEVRRPKAHHQTVHRGWVFGDFNQPRCTQLNYSRMKEVLLILLAYLIGSIPTAIWVSRS